MIKTTKLIIGIVITIIVIFGVWYGITRKPAEKSAIKIGAILSLTGDYGAIGEEINKGALIAVEEARQKGLYIEYIAEDDRFEMTGFVNAGHKLQQVDKVDAALTAWATGMKAIAPLFNQAKIPLLAIWDNTNYMKTAGKYIFTSGFSTEKNGEKMAEYAIKNLELKRVGIIYQSEEWSDLIAQSFAKRFQDLGGQVVLNERLLLSDRDFRTLLTRAKGLNVDGIYFPLNAPANSIFLKQAKQLGVQGKLMTGDALIQEEIDTAGPASEGVYFTNVYTQNPEGLMQKYQQKYHMNSGAPAAVAFGYDGINVLVEAKKIATAENIPLRDALTKVKIQGVGSLINMNGGQYSDRVEKLYKIINGKTVEVE